MHILSQRLLLLDHRRLQRNLHHDRDFDRDGRDSNRCNADLAHGNRRLSTHIYNSHAPIRDR